MIRLRSVRAKLTKVSTLLEEERDYILEGALDQLATTVEAREELLRQITRDGIGEEHSDLLDIIRARAEANVGLLESFREGVQDAENTLARIAKAQSQLGTYDAKGAVSATTVTAPRHERRA